MGRHGRQMGSSQEAPGVSTSERDVLAVGRRGSADVVFIIGAARSGTTLLYKALCLHPDVSYISNWVGRFPGLPWLASLDRIARRMPAARRRVWFGRDSNAYVYGTKRRVRDRIFPMPVEGEPVYGRCGIRKPGGPSVAAVDDPEERLRGLLRSIGRSSGGSIFVSKRIANNLRIPLLARTFPEARFVEIVRDGRAVAYSLSRVDWWESSVVWWYGGTPEQWRDEGRDPWDMCARNWLEELREIRSGLAVVEPQQVSSIRFEALTDDPIRTLESVAAFIGLPSSAGWRAELGRLQRPDRSETWRTGLDDAVAQKITSIQLEELRALGYRL